MVISIIKRKDKIDDKVDKVGFGINDRVKGISSLV